MSISWGDVLRLRVRFAEDLARPRNAGISEEDKNFLEGALRPAYMSIIEPHNWGAVLDRLADVPRPSIKSLVLRAAGYLSPESEYLIRGRVFSDFHSYIMAPAGVLEPCPHCRGSGASQPVDRESYRIASDLDAQKVLLRWAHDNGYGLTKDGKAVNLTLGGEIT